MPHIHKLYDFVVSVFIVHRNKVLLIYHKKYKEWLPIGGHIELNEDPEDALYREIKEECGLKVRILADCPKIGHGGVKPLPTPAFADVHRIPPAHPALARKDWAHKHIAFIYFGVARTNRVRLHAREHREYRWVGAAELKNREFRLTKSILFYCRKALQKAAS